MKKMIFAAAFLFSCLSFKLADAQVSVHLGVNIGTQPAWGPVGYEHVDYYYMPDIDAYYYVPTHQYIYLNGPTWVRTTYLPPAYRGYDVYRGYKVVVNEPRPWIRHDYYRTTYATYRNRHDQVIIRDRPQYRTRYVEHHDNGKHNGWDKHDHDDHGHGDHGNHGHGKGR
jgi:hypothetical protein